jgi:type IV secretion system protein VirB10
MNTKQLVAELNELPVSPWGKTQSTGIVVPGDTDPRLELSEQALVQASHNSFPIVAQQKSRRDNLGLLAGAGIAVVLGVATFASMSSTRTEDVASKGSEVVKSAPAGTPSPIAPMSGHPTPMTTPQGVTHPGGMPAEGAMAGHPMANVQPMANAPSPVVVWDSGNVPSGAAPPMGEKANDSGGGPGMLAGGTAFQGLTTSNSSAARSTRMAEPANTVAQGTLIPAVLETAIDSDLPGYVRAVVSQDIRSFDGSRVLVPRSSRLIGEYKSGLTAGQRRAYLLWTRLIRPDGVSVALASPAVGFSGQSGVEGKVNTHFFQRFGSAILLSVLGGASTMARGGSTVVVSGGQSAASIAAQRDGERPPTIHVRQGQPVRVFTARDLIFSGDAG